jgi:hypothetical protein
MAEEHCTQNEVLLHAFNAARKTHADFEALEPIMLTIAKAFTPDFTRIKLSEFLESLYVIAKYANFIAPEVRQAAAFHTSANAVLEARSASRSVM